MCLFNKFVVGRYFELEAVLMENLIDAFPVVASHIPSVCTSFFTFELLPINSL